MGTVNQKTTQMIVVSDRTSFVPHQNAERVALFNEDGTPLGLAGDNSDVTDRLDSVEDRLAALEAKQS